MFLLILLSSVIINPPLARPDFPIRCVIADDRLYGVAGAQYGYKNIEDAYLLMGESGNHILLEKSLIRLTTSARYHFPEALHESILFNELRMRWQIVSGRLYILNYPNTEALDSYPESHEREILSQSINIIRLLQTDPIPRRRN